MFIVRLFLAIVKIVKIFFQGIEGMLKGERIK